jgi:ribosome-interacting GTPase 1
VPNISAVSANDEDNADAPESLQKRLLIAANKTDAAGADDNLVGFRELCPCPFTIMPISTADGRGTNELLAELYRMLGVIRIYAKKPGQPADRKDPFILPAGSTVHDIAFKVHRELAERLRSARVWGADVHDGQQVHATHVLSDRTVVELHFDR